MGAAKKMVSNKPTVAKKARSAEHKFGRKSDVAVKVKAEMKKAAVEKQDDGWMTAIAELPWACQELLMQFLLAVAMILIVGLPKTMVVVMLIIALLKPTMVSAIAEAATRSVGGVASGWTWSSGLMIVACAILTLVAATVSFRTRGEKKKVNDDGKAKKRQIKELQVDQYKIKRSLTDFEMHSRGLDAVPAAAKRHCVGNGGKGQKGKKAKKPKDNKTGDGAGAGEVDVNP